MRDTYQESKRAPPPHVTRMAWGPWSGLPNVGNERQSVAIQRLFARSARRPRSETSQVGRRQASPLAVLIHYSSHYNVMPRQLDR